LFYLPSSGMLDTLLNQDQMPFHSFTLLLTKFVNGAHHALVARTKNNQLQGPEVTLIYGY
jgi:hypothetical protein